MSLCPHCGSPIYEIGVEFIFADNIVRAGETTCRLRPTQMQILEHLIDAYPRALATDALHAAIFEDRTEETMPAANTLAAYVFDLRKRLRESSMPIEILSVTTTGQSGIMVVPTTKHEFIQKVA